MSDTRQELIDYLSRSELSVYSEEYGILFVWEYTTDTDRVHAKALGARLVVVPGSLWLHDTPSVEEFIAMVLRGDAR